MDTRRFWGIQNFLFIVLAVAIQENKIISFLNRAYLFSAFFYIQVIMYNKEFNVKNKL